MTDDIKPKKSRVRIALNAVLLSAYEIVLSVDGIVPTNSTWISFLNSTSAIGIVTPNKVITQQPKQQQMNQPFFPGLVVGLRIRTMFV